MVITPVIGRRVGEVSGELYAMSGTSTRNSPKTYLTEVIFRQILQGIERLAGHEPRGVKAMP